MQSLISFLINDCCNGHPELCGLLGVSTENLSSGVVVVKSTKDGV